MLVAAVERDGREGAETHGVKSNSQAAAMKQLYQKSNIVNKKKY